MTKQPWLDGKNSFTALANFSSKLTSDHVCAHYTSTVMTMTFGGHPWVIRSIFRGTIGENPSGNDQIQLLRSWIWPDDVLESLIHQYSHACKHIFKSTTKLSCQILAKRCRSLASKKLTLDVSKSLQHVQCISFPAVTYYLQQVSICLSCIAYTNNNNMFLVWLSVLTTRHGNTN